MEFTIEPLIGTYAGYITESGELLSCTSGGIATALSRNMIRQGGLVAGVSYTPDFYKARYELVSEESALERFKGSKYFEVQKHTIYRDVKAQLDLGKQVLFFGLPCAVAALKSHLGREYTNLLTVALICHGPTYRQVHQQYLRHLEHRFGSKVTDFSVRRKEGRWTPANLYAKFADGQVFQQKFDETEYGKAFYMLSKGGCYNCPFRSGLRQWDLTIGDFWGAQEMDPFWNPAGVSAILAHTQKGLDFLKATADIQLFNASVLRIVEGNPCLVSPRQPKPGRDDFLKNWKTHGLFSCFEPYNK